MSSKWREKVSEHLTRVPTYTAYLNGKITLKL